MAVDRTRHGPVALVTGAAQGLGEAFARALAREGLELVLVDVDEPALRRVAASLGATAVHADLATEDAIDRIVAACEGRAVGLLVNNAAVSRVGAFATADEHEMLRHLAVNTRAPLLLTRRFLPAMIARGAGGVVLLSSIAAFHGAPGFATYAATKAFILALGESLAYELGGTGVDLLVACPGATDTPGLRACDPDPNALRGVPFASAEDTAREVLAALGRGPTHVAGRANRLTGAVLDRLLPRRWATGAMGFSLRRLYPSLDRR